MRVGTKWASAVTKGLVENSVKSKDRQKPARAIRMRTQDELTQCSVTRYVNWTVTFQTFLKVALAANLLSCALAIKVSRDYTPLLISVGDGGSGAGTGVGEGDWAESLDEPHEESSLGRTSVVSPTGYSRTRGFVEPECWRSAT